MRGRLLLTFVASRDAESYTAIVVGLRGRGKVEIGKRNLLIARRPENPEGLADYGVILYFQLVLVTEYQDGVGHERRTRSLLCIFFWLSFARFMARPVAMVYILIAVFLFLAEHLLLFETALVPLFGALAIAFIFIVEA